MSGTKAILSALGHRANAAVRVSATLVVVVLAQSVFWADQAPIAIKLGTACIGLLAYLRPRQALLVVATLAPVGYTLTTRVLDAHPVRGAEALVLAFLAGWLLRPRRGNEPPTRDAATAVALILAAVVVASAAVEVIALQAWKDYPWPFLQNLFHFLAIDYHTLIPDARPWVGGRSGFGPILSAALFLEGISLWFVARALLRRDRSFARLLTMATVAGAVAAASFTLVPLLLAIASANYLEVGLAAMVGQRWSAHLAKPVSAGSYFAMILPIAMFMASASDARRRLAWQSAAVMIAAALWLTGSRASIIPTVFALGALLTWFVISRFGARRQSHGSRVAVWLTPALVLVGIAAIWPYLLRPGALESLAYRFTTAVTGLRMWSDNALFGVGIGQYYLSSGFYVPPGAPAYYANVNAHNGLLQIAAELGAIGLAGFAAAIAVSLRAAWTSARSGSQALLARGVLAGLTIFLVSDLGGQALLLHDVAYPFWLLLGLAGALDATGNGLGSDLASDARLTRSRRLVAATLGLLLITLPSRVDREISEIDFTRVEYGFHGWETDGAGVRYRWTKERARFFVASTTRAVDLSVQPFDIGFSGPVGVNVLLDGQLFDRISLEDNGWRQIRLRLPPTSAHRFWQLDLRIDHTFTPSEVIEGSTDVRRLGVKTRELAFQ